MNVLLDKVRDLHWTTCEISLKYISYSFFGDLSGPKAFTVDAGGRGPGFDSIPNWTRYVLKKVNTFSVRARLFVRSSNRRIIFTTASPYFECLVFRNYCTVEINSPIGNCAHTHESAQGLVHSPCDCSPKLRTRSTVRRDVLVS